MLDAAVDTLDQGLDGLRLIAGRLKIGNKGKSIHSATLYSFNRTGSMGSRHLQTPSALATGRACVHHFFAVPRLLRLC